LGLKPSKSYKIQGIKPGKIVDKDPWGSILVLENLDKTLNLKLI